VKTNSSFARPSPWSAPVLPPVKVDATKLEPRPDEGEFKVGETVVYPARGVADIVAVEDKEIGGRRQSFYVLRVHDTEQKILVPVNNAAQIGLRRPISEAQVREIFRILKVTDVPLDTQTWNRRYRGFVEKLATGSVFAVAEVLRDLSRVKIVKDGLSFSERQMLERARGLIVKEIAVARAKPEDAVRQQIEAIFA
jgi:CarD family transcriptional regulator